MEPRDSYSNHLSGTLSGAGALVDAIALARAFGEAQRLAEADLARFCIVVEELVANLFDHGQLTELDRIALTFAREAGHVRIALTDPGAAFDPRQVPPNGERSDRGGGAGIDLVRAWAEIVGYEVTGDGNRLELLMPIG